ncbi:DUF6515 family protein [Desulforhopalus sp. IMCC35007]|uniref:DUF6515 family protein n=1 Tax=Desulforhopalus sp. IMCC35007 TaxID=2569543 RepID=UPI0010ADE61B|nr:DUF6515 family protein [Desulforhopalus sp. IMCC35007]TKB12249.1 hypothetical protein FCL48_00945 [Desulforhopalus sp. IMCC35007]
MLKVKKQLCWILLIGNIFFVSGAVLAGPGGEGRRGGPSSPGPGYMFDQRYQHNHYYPRPGAMVNALPGGYRSVPFRGDHYFFHGGAWYRPNGPGFVVTAPPIGLAVSFLPLAYTTIWVGGIPYYYADNTYYTWAPERRVYVVSEPPPDSEVIEDPEMPNKIFVYPKEGQSQEQQATDRYECHSWAKGQTGFDPTQPVGGVAAAQNSAKRQDYNRAMRACLDARGYSTK